MDHMEFGEFFERTWNCSEFRICTACMVCINVHAWEHETAPWHHMTSHGIACFACIACDKGFFPSILISLARRHRLSQLEDLVTLRFEIVGVMEAYQSHHGIAHRNLIIRRQEIEMWLIPRNMRLKITELSSADFSFGVAWGCLAKGVGSKLNRSYDDYGHQRCWKRPALRWGVAGYCCGQVVNCSDEAYAACVHFLILSSRWLHYMRNKLVDLFPTEEKVRLHWAIPCEDRGWPFMLQPIDVSRFLSQFH